MYTPKIADLLLVAVCQTAYSLLDTLFFVFGGIELVISAASVIYCIYIFCTTRKEQVPNLFLYLDDLAS